jgi:hypothetical protein
MAWLGTCVHGCGDDVPAKRGDEPARKGFSELKGLTQDSAAVSSRTKMSRAMLATCVAKMRRRTEGGTFASLRCRWVVRQNLRAQRGLQIGHRLRLQGIGTESKTAAYPQIVLCYGGEVTGGRGNQNWPATVDT